MLLGFVLNQFATYHYVLITHPIVTPLYVSEFVLILILAFISYTRATQLSNVKKARYTFMGVSLVSFLFTLWDFFSVLCPRRTLYQNVLPTALHMVRRSLIAVVPIIINSWSFLQFLGTFYRKF